MPIGSFTVPMKYLDIAIEFLKMLTSPWIEDVRVGWRSDRFPEFVGPVFGDLRVGEVGFDRWLVLRLKFFYEGLHVIFIQ